MTLSLRKSQNASVRVGDKLYVYGRRMTSIAEIKSMHVNDVAHDTVDVTAEQEIGLRLGIRGSIGCDLIRLK
jgi:selenocysteine-specific translation elongation factor